MVAGREAGLSRIEHLSAITLATHDMVKALAFYRALGCETVYGGPSSAFTSLRAGTGFINLVAQPRSTEWQWWGRMIFHVDDVDEVYRQFLDAGYETDTVPRDAEWGERYFHITDPDGHELSFAKPL